MCYKIIANEKNYVYYFRLVIVNVSIIYFFWRITRKTRAKSKSDIRHSIICFSPVHNNLVCNNRVLFIKLYSISQNSNRRMCFGNPYSIYIYFYLSFPSLSKNKFGKVSDFCNSSIYLFLLGY